MLWTSWTEWGRKNNTSSLYTWTISGFRGRGFAAKGEQIGYLPQRFGMFHELKVKEMMYYFAAAKKGVEGKKRGGD